MKRVKLSKPGGLQNLMLEESTIPEPNDNQVLIRVMSSSLNYHDLLVALGGIPVADGRIVLSDCAGEIVKCGPNVKIWQKGDRVISCCHPHWRSGPPNPKFLSFIETMRMVATEYTAISETSITCSSNWTQLNHNIAMCSLNSGMFDRERKSEAKQTVPH